MEPASPALVGGFLPQVTPGKPIVYTVFKYPPKSLSEWGIIIKVKTWNGNITKISMSWEVKYIDRSYIFSPCRKQKSEQIGLQFSSVQSLSHVRLFTTQWTATCQVSLSITNSWSLLKLMSIKSVMPSNRLILCDPLLLQPSIFPSIFSQVFSKKSVLRIRWPNYWSFSFSISPSNEYSGLISFRMDWLDLLAVQGTLKNLL